MQATYMQWLAIQAAMADSAIAQLALYGAAADRARQMPPPGVCCAWTTLRPGAKLQDSSPLLQLPFIVEDQKAPVGDDELATHSTVGGMGPPYPVLHRAAHTLPMGELEQFCGKAPLTRVLGGTPGHPA